MPATAAILASTPQAAPGRTSPSSGAGTGFASALSNAIGAQASTGPGSASVLNGNAPARTAQSLASGTTLEQAETSVPVLPQNAVADALSTNTPSAAAGSPAAHQDAAAPVAPDDAATAAALSATQDAIPSAAQDQTTAALPVPTPASGATARTGGARLHKGKDGTDAPTADQDQDAKAPVSPDATLLGLPAPIAATPMPDPKPSAPADSAAGTASAAGSVEQGRVGQSGVAATDAEAGAEDGDAAELAGPHGSFAQMVHHAQSGQEQAPAAATTPAGQAVNPDATALAAAPAGPRQADATGSAAPAAAAHGGGAAAPAAQIAPVIVSMAGDQPGNQQLVVQLAPEELGRVEIRIDRSQDGPASVQVTAERPETLQLLQHDAPALQRTLDQAGFAQEGRTLSFHLATTETRPTQSADGSNTGWTGAGTQDGSGYRQPENQSGNQGGNQSGSQGQAFRAASGFFGAEQAAAAASTQSSATPIRFRAGINITA